MTEPLPDLLIAPVVRAALAEDLGRAVAELDPTADFKAVVEDGARVGAGEKLAWVDANARALLSAERTALNLLGRLSGVATLTRAYVDAVEDSGAMIVDTRKTTPGLRALE